MLKVDDRRISVTGMVFTCAVVALVFAATGCKDESAGGGEASATERSINVDATGKVRPRQTQQSAASGDIASLWPPVRAQPASVIEFGQVIQNEVTTRHVELVNSGDVDVRLASSRTNCGCTTAEVTGLVIPANGSLELPLHFDAEGRTGIRSATVTLFFEDWERPIQLRVSAEVIPAR